MIAKRLKLFVAFALVATGASAQGAPSTGGSEIPKGTVKGSATGTVSTNDVATGSFATGTTAASTDTPDADATELSLAAGGLFSSGNARTFALTSIAKFRLRRDIHQFSTAAAANYARAGKQGESVDTTIQNFQGLGRYDHFLAERLSLFIQATFRNDRFQGLDLRTNIDPGVALYFVQTKRHKLWGEAGYDLQYDIRRDEARVPVQTFGSPRPELVDKTRTLHNARLFVGFENKLYEQVAFTSSIEYLQNFADVDTYRFIFDAGLRSQIAQRLAISTNYTLRYENKPLPTILQSDSLMSVNLVYTLF